jgi:flagellar FliL protein
MADTTTLDEPPAAKSSKMPLIIGLVLAIGGGAGGFFAAYKGIIPFGESDHQAAEESPKTGSPDVAFVPIEPLTISLPQHSSNKHLRFRAELEVAKEYASEVALISPRIVDVMNSYLRALEVADLEDPAALTRLRAQIFRRVQTVAGPGRIKDVLIMEFVLN